MLEMSLNTGFQVDAETSKMFLLHSRNSSGSSFVSEVEVDDSVELSNTKGPVSSLTIQESEASVERERHRRCKLSANGRCLCKLSIGLYLATCVVVSALYVVFYGKNQAFFGEAWIPGKPTVHEHNLDSVGQQKFQDLPYTEWISQRWTYDHTPYADWPTLPSNIDQIQQVLEGEMVGSGGLWILTSSQLYFVRLLNGGLPAAVEMINISDSMELSITSKSYLAPVLANSFFLVTPSNITYVDCSKVECKMVDYLDDTQPFDYALSSTYSLSDKTLWLGTTHGLYNLSYGSQEDGISLSDISEVGVDQVHTLAWRSVVSGIKNSRYDSLRPFLPHMLVANRLQESYACSSSSGMRWTGSYWGQHQEFGVLVVGMSDKVHFYDGTHWWFEWVSDPNMGLGGVIEGIPTAMTFGPSGELYIANNDSLMRLNINYTFNRIGPLDGLPYNQLTSLHISPYAPKNPPPFGPVSAASQLGTLWIGTAKGYTLFDIQSSEFLGYYHGPRWLPGERVERLVGSGRAVIAVTEAGLAVIHPEEWTLAHKAKHYQDMLERHTRPPGLVGDCPIANYTPSTCVPGPTDNDGLWTSWLVGAEAFRYHVTKDPVARANAWSLYSGLRLLVDVTDTQGFMARSVMPDNSSVGGLNWHESTSLPGWHWRGGTSSDEVVGHMFAYPLVHDLLLADREKAKQDVEDLVEDITESIMDHKYTLLDPDNKTTHWGVWSPAQLNLNRSWSDARGINSLQILAYLLSAYRLTGDNQFLDAYKEMFSGVYGEVPTHYGMNVINQKMMTSPRADSLNDDQLSFLPYMLYYYTLRHLDKHQLEALGPGALHVANLSLERSWAEIRRGKSSPWTVIYAYATGKMDDENLLEKLVWNLRTWPVELVQWPTHNSHRLDIRINPELHRDMRKGTRSVHVLPANERSQLRWNIDPFQLDGTGSSSEMDPGPWLLPYWMARWCKML